MTTLNLVTLNCQTEAGRTVTLFRDGDLINPIASIPSDGTGAYQFGSIVLASATTSSPRGCPDAADRVDLGLWKKSQFEPPETGRIDKPGSWTTRSPPTSAPPLRARHRAGPLKTCAFHFLALPPKPLI
ncbi:MAG: hypothetical protein WD768_12030 [Phycisphaeraceae bacterium]